MRLMNTSTGKGLYKPVECSLGRCRCVESEFEIKNNRNIFLTIELNPRIGKDNLPQIKSILKLLSENKFNSYVEKDNQMVEISDGNLMQLVESKSVDAFFGREHITI